MRNLKTLGRALKSLAPLILLAVIIPQAACEKSKIREARKAAHRIQVVTDAAVDTTKSLYGAGVISREQTNKIALALLDVNKANRVLIEKAAAMTEDTAANRKELFTTLGAITEAVRELKASGVLHIKNQNSQLAFETTINALDASLAAIEAALSGG